MRKKLLLGIVVVILLSGCLREKREEARGKILNYEINFGFGMSTTFTIVDANGSVFMLTLSGQPNSLVPINKTVIIYSIHDIVEVDEVD